MQPMSPQWLPSVTITPTIDRKRGFLLTAFLLLSMFGNIILCGVLVIMAGIFAGVEHADDGLNPGADYAARMVHNAMLFLALLAVVNLVFLTGAWMWKKWGVYGYGLVSCLGMLVALKIAPASAMLNVVWGGIVTALVASKWRHFE
jgi:hypothetical protein